MSALLVFECVTAIRDARSPSLYEIHEMVHFAEAILDTALDEDVIYRSSNEKQYSKVCTVGVF